MASFTFFRVLLAIWTVMMMAAVAHVSGSRNLLAVPDGPKGVGDACLHNGQLYYYCKSGGANGGCRPKAQGAFPEADCNSRCTLKLD